MLLMSCPSTAARFQSDMNHYKQSPEYQNPVMQKAISTLIKNFAEVKKDMSILLANNLARVVLSEVMSLSSSVVAHITLCSVYKLLSLEAPGINYPAWFFPASIYGPDHEQLRPYRD
jgi:hypothetical protein